MPLSYVTVYRSTISLPLFPDEKFKLCKRRLLRLDVGTCGRPLFSPIGKGQRALIVAQPKTGKTILMKEIANAIAANHPEDIGSCC